MDGVKGPFWRLQNPSLSCPIVSPKASGLDQAGGGGGSLFFWPGFELVDDHVDEAIEFSGETADALDVLVLLCNGGKTSELMTVSWSFAILLDVTEKFRLVVFAGGFRGSKGVVDINLNGE